MVMSLRLRTPTAELLAKELIRDSLECGGSVIRLGSKITGLSRQCRIAVIVNTLPVTGDNPEIAAAGINEKQE
jgi:hypothetical protein